MMITDASVTIMTKDNGELYMFEFTMFTWDGSHLRKQLPSSKPYFSQESILDQQKD